MGNFTVNCLKGEVFGPSPAEVQALKGAKHEPTKRRTIVGAVTAVSPEESKLGDFSRLIGVFRCKMPNGDVYESSECILPRRAERYVLALYGSAAAEDRQKGVPFKVELWCEHDAEDKEAGKKGTPTGYGWRHADPEAQGVASRVPAL